MSTEIIKYINNNPSYGIQYDWKKITKRCKKLGIYPDDPTIWNPLSVPIASDTWHVIMSIRSKGKTTNSLLLGLVMYWMYGTVAIYVGQNKDQIRPKNTESLYNIIRTYNYVDLITGGRWNDIKLYTGGKWYLINTDDAGNIIEKDNTACCEQLAVSEHEIYKSKRNFPTGDLIIFDEFLAKAYYPNEFLDLCDLLSTVIRDRQNVKLFLLSNTINKHHTYFNELDIYDEVQALEAGHSFQHETYNGTRLYCTIIDPSVTERKKIFNRMYFGFKNPGLGAITGETTWSESNYPHCINSEKTKTLIHNIYIYYNKKLVNLEVVTNDVGLCINAHWAKRTYDDSIIYTINPMYDRRYRYRLGDPTSSRIDKIINNLFKSNKVYYSTNDVGSFVSSYLQEAKVKL